MAETTYLASRLETEPTISPAALYSSVENYPWDTDPEFQSGLHAILGGPSAVSAATLEADSDAQTQSQELTLRARCFYYALKINIDIDFLDYKAWRDAQPATHLSSLAPAAPMPAHDDSAPSSVETTPSKVGADRANSVVKILGDAQKSGGADNSYTQAHQAASTEQIQNGKQEYQDMESTPTHSFAAIVDLINKGLPLPGIKDIPKTVLKDQATQATKTTRKKPWEERVEKGANNSDAGGDGRLWFGLDATASADFGTDGGE